MELLAGLSILVGLPLFGWWLIRATRSWNRLAKVMSDESTYFGFLHLKGRTSAVLLFSDVRFVFWLLRRKYRDHQSPPEVTKALEQARRDYIRVNLVMGVIVVFGFIIAVGARFAR